MQINRSADKLRNKGVQCGETEVQVQVQVEVQVRRCIGAELQLQI